MSTREKILIVTVILAILGLIYLWNNPRIQTSFVGNYAPSVSPAKQYRIEYNYPHEIRVVLMGEFSEDSLKGVARIAATEVARDATRKGYAQDFVSYEVDSGIFIVYEDGTEKIFPDIKVYHLRKK